MRARKRGACRKTIYDSWRLAAGVRNRTEAERPYFCPLCAGYHLTSMTRSEFDRHQATKYA